MILVANVIRHAGLPVPFAYLFSRFQTEVANLPPNAVVDLFPDEDDAPDLKPNWGQL
jgi:hypothetical protein